LVEAMTHSSVGLFQTSLAPENERST